MEGTYLLISLFCAFFGAVYEVFSHGVFSYYMIYAFAIPLTGGVLMFWIIGRKGWSYPSRIAGNLYHSGIATLTVGCTMQGVLEIYGTTNKLISIYWIAGTVLLFMGTGCYLWKNLHQKYPWSP